jgi:RNA polymerase sigma-70 factor (ECF subfamily)
MVSDAELVAAALAGGAREFGAVVERYRDSVFGVALSRLRNFHDAEDVTQTVFVEAFGRLVSLRDPSRLGAWLRGITLHQCIDLVRRRPDTTEFEEDAAPARDETETPQARLEREELRDRIMAAIGRLSNAQRETTVLYYINGYSQDEVAAIQEVPVGTVKRRLHEARNHLRQEMVEMVQDVLQRETPKEDLSQRVYELLCRYPDKRPRWPEVIEELRRIGTPGIEGFIRAFALPHARTRTWALQMLAWSRPGNTEVVVELLKQGLKDSNKKVRRTAAAALLHVDVPDERARTEFVPLVAALLTDPSRRVRRTLSTWWVLGPRAVDMPVPALVAALKQEQDPQVRRRMEELLLHVLEARTLQ